MAKDFNKKVAEGALALGGRTLKDFELPPLPQTKTPPISHTDLHNDTANHDAEQQHDGATDNNTHNIVGNSAEATMEGVATSVPTYQGKHNKATKIATHIIDAVGDVMTKYLLEPTNRRKLLNVNADINRYIDGASMLLGAVEDPVGTAIKGAVGMTKSSLDGIEGQNVFEMLSRKGILTMEEQQDIRLKELGVFRGKQKIAQNHFGTDENGDIYLKTAHEYLKDKMDGTYKHSKPNRMTLSDNLNEEMVFLKHPATLPFIIIVIVLYRALHDSKFNIDDYHSSFSVVDAMLEQAVSVVLKDVIGLDDKATTFALDCLTTLPQELITAFLRNVDKKVGLTNDERVAIDDYVKRIKGNFKRIYNRTLEKAVKSFQGNNMNLYTMLIELNTDDVLHNIAIQLKTADNVLWEAINNNGLFLGLLELTSIHKKGTGDLFLTDNDIGNKYFFEGVVRYLGKPNNLKNITDPKLNILMDMERNNGALKIKGGVNTGLYRNGNDYFVAIKGSSLPTDLTQNFNNVAGSQELFNTDRYKEADGLLDEAQNLADKSGGFVHLLGHSLGGTIASHLATKHQGVYVDAYDPVIPLNDMTKKMIKETEHSNILFHTIDNSPISSNLDKYENFNLRHRRRYKQKRYSSHSIMNFM